MAELSEGAQEHARGQAALGRRRKGRVSPSPAAGMTSQQHAGQVGGEGEEWEGLSSKHESQDSQGPLPLEGLPLAGGL